MGPQEPVCLVSWMRCALPSIVRPVGMYRPAVVACALWGAAGRGAWRERQPSYGSWTRPRPSTTSVGKTVFVERRDTMNGTQVTFQVVGVFDVDADGKIAAWRDYLDSKENPVKVGAQATSR
jgi:hypothetical protein